MWAYLYLYSWGCEVGPGLWVCGRLRVVVHGRLHIGSLVSIRSGYSNIVGANQPFAALVGPGAELDIGDGCGLSNIHIVTLKSVRVLPETFIGGGTRIYDTDFHQLDPESRIFCRGSVPDAAIVIGPRAFIGGHCTILKGVTIGEGAVIGAGSVVTRDIPPYEIWAGVPAHHLRKVR